MTAYLASERTVANITLTFPFTTNNLLSWVDWGGNPNNEKAQLGVDGHQAAANISTHIQHTHNSDLADLAPLASPVESSVLQ